MVMKKRFVALLVCVLTVLSMALTAFAAENGNGHTEKDGVIIETTTDKDTYTSGDTATFTITITNTNDYDVSDVSILYDVPANFEIQAANIPSSIDLIKAGESASLTFSTVVTSDTEAPSSGSPVIIIVIVAVVVVVVAIVVIILLKKKKKTSALILVGALLAGSLGGLVTAPSAEVNAEVTNADYKRVSVHDPSIVKDPKTGTYYVFGSHMGWAKSTDLISWTNFTMNINTDYSNIFGDVWNNYCKTTANPNVSGNLWAPDVIYNETMGKWCMYMSVNGNNWQSVIVLLTADNIEGPYEYVGGVTYSGFYDNGDGNAARLNTARAEYSDVYRVLGEGADLTRYSKTSQSLVNCIDPNVEYDREGNLWMTYGSWSGGIYQLKLDLTTGLRDYNYTYENELNVSDAYLGYKLAGGYYNSGEGAYILKTDDYFYLFVSIGNLEASGGYNMRVYRSESINGPYTDENGSSAILKSWMGNLGYKGDENWEITAKYNSSLGIKLMGAYNMYGVSRIQVAQGHNSAFVDDDGRMYVVYHTRFAGGGEGHEVRVHQLVETESGWITATPYEYSGETVSTENYTAEDVAGAYEFLIHRKDLVYAVNAPATEGESFWATSYKTITVNSEDVTLTMRRISWQESGEKITDSQGIVYAADINLNADGTITGDAEGTWELTTGANVKMTIDGVEYSGAFVEQQNELSTRNMTMTFTLIGGDHSAWGVKNPNKN